MRRSAVHSVLCWHHTVTAPKRCADKNPTCSFSILKKSMTPGVRRVPSPNCWGCPARSCKHNTHAYADQRVKNPTYCQPLILSRWLASVRQLAAGALMSPPCSCAGRQNLAGSLPLPGMPAADGAAHPLRPSPHVENCPTPLRKPCVEGGSCIAALSPCAATSSQHAKVAKPPARPSDLTPVTRWPCTTAS